MLNDNSNSKLWVKNQIYV